MNNNLRVEDVVLDIHALIKSMPKPDYNKDVVECERLAKRYPHESNRYNKLATHYRELSKK